MIIEIITDKNTTKNNQQITQLKSTIANELRVYSKDITHIEANLSDETRSKTGELDNRCMLEARIENWQSVAVTSFASTTDQSVTDALAKLKEAVIRNKLKRH